MNVIQIVKFTDIIGEKYGGFIDTYFAQEGWQLLMVECDGLGGYQVFFGPGVQVDNNYEYGFPYVFDLAEVKAFAKDFYTKRNIKIDRKDGLSNE